jgi:hypothetical protein
LRLEKEDTSQRWMNVPVSMMVEKALFWFGGKHEDGAQPSSLGGSVMFKFHVERNSVNLKLRCRLNLPLF